MLKDKLVRAALRALHKVEDARRSAEPLSTIRNFLLLQHHRALGAAVGSTALITALPKVIPGARVIVTAGGFSLETLANNPAIERLESCPDPRMNMRGALNVLRAAPLFAGERYATILNIGTSRGEFRLAALFSGSRDTLYFSMLPQHEASLEYDYNLSRIANDLRFLQLLGHGPALERAMSDDPTLWEPRIFVTHDELTAAHALLQAQGLERGTAFALIMAQSRPHPVRYWPPERFRAMAEFLFDTFGLVAVFIGAQAEAATIDGIRAGLRTPNVNVAGLTTIRDLAALAKLATVGFGYDTGSMHVARAVRLPAVILAPPHESAVEWVPLGDPNFRILFNANAVPGTPFRVPGQTTLEEAKAATVDLMSQRA